jgi:hypothetical protein
MIRLAAALAGALWAGPSLAQGPAPAAPGVGLRLAAQIESARGRSSGTFRNGLAGVRVDLLFAPRVSLGGYVGYANLKGKDDRAHAVLSYAQLEYLVPLAPHLMNLRVPLRFGTGYLSHNGAVLRASAGLAVSLTPRVDLVTELLTPMVWVTNDQTLFSTNVSLEIAARF